MLSTVIQSIFAARLLGVLGFGVLGTIISFASNINRLLSFRMGELVVKFVGQSLNEGKKERAAVAFKAAALTETLTSIAAFLLLVLAAPLAARYIIKDTTTTSLIMIYGLALLANFVTESSTGLLQVGGHFRSQAVISLVQSLVTAALIVYAYFIHGSIWLVLGAYLLGKSINGLALAGVAFWRARQMFGQGWGRVSLSLLPARREFWGFAASTNLSGTITMMTRDNEEFWISLLLSPLQTGYYKVAKAVINLVVLPITPFISTSYPEMTRAVGEKAWSRLRSLLRRLTIISVAWTGAVAIGLLLFGNSLITHFYGAEFAPSTPAMLILLAGFGFANIFYWNRNLLLSLGQPNYPLVVMAITGVVKIVLSFLLVPHFGYLMETGLISAFFIVSIGLISLRGIQGVQRLAENEPAEPMEPEPVLPVERFL
jgi:O-antigen/teichoic acid export membrane protein